MIGKTDPMLDPIKTRSPVEPVYTFTTAGGAGGGIKIKGVPIVIDMDPTGPGAGFTLKGTTLAKILDYKRIKRIAKTLIQKAGDSEIKVTEKIKKALKKDPNNPVYKRYSMRNTKEIKKETKNNLNAYDNMVENLKNIDSLIYTGVEVALAGPALFTGIASEPLKAVSETKKFMNIFKKKIEEEGGEIIAKK